MTSSSRTIESDAFWHAAIDAANADPDFHARSAHLHDVALRLRIGDLYQCDLNVHGGHIKRVERIDSPAPAFTIAGPLAAWSNLVSGATPYGAATNVVLGQLRVSGDPLVAIWLTRPLWQLWRITSQLIASGVEHE